MLAATAACSLPMLTPQWMTQLAAAGYGYGVYDINTGKLSFSEIIVPFLDYLTGLPSNDKGKFAAELQSQDVGVGNFELTTLTYIGLFPGDPTGYVTYSYDTKKIHSPTVKISTTVRVMGKLVTLPTEQELSNVELIQVEVDEGTDKVIFQVDTYDE
jgi:hypothetical protein